VSAVTLNILSSMPDGVNISHACEVFSAVVSNLSNVPYSQIRCSIEPVVSNFTTARVTSAISAWSPQPGDSLFVVSLRVEEIPDPRSPVHSGAANGILPVSVLLSCLLVAVSSRIVESESRP